MQIVLSYPEGEADMAPRHKLDSQIDLDYSQFQSIEEELLSQLDFALAKISPDQLDLWAGERAMEGVAA